MISLNVQPLPDRCSNVLLYLDFIVSRARTEAYLISHLFTFRVKSCSNVLACYLNPMYTIYLQVSLKALFYTMGFQSILNLQN